MHWSDTAIVLSLRKHGESSAVMRVLAREHGVAAGVVRAASSKTNRGIFQPGNILSVAWNARLAEHLGSFKGELLEANTAYLLSDKTALSALSSACALLQSALPEHHPYPKLYAAFELFLSHLRTENPDHYLMEYIHLEMLVLSETGFGLDLSACAATGATEDLIYVSPKSGRAVSRAAGEPYKERLLRLPFMLSPKGRAIEDGLALTGYFLEHWLLEPHGKKMPAARARLASCIMEKV